MTSKGLSQASSSGGPLHRKRTKSRPIHPQTSRTSTPDPNVDPHINTQGDLSRDELARTNSAHDSRRRKRVVDEDSDGEQYNDPSPSGSPKRVKVGNSQRVSLPKASSQPVQSHKPKASAKRLTQISTPLNGGKTVKSNGTTKPNAEEVLEYDDDTSPKVSAKPLTQTSTSFNGAKPTKVNGATKPAAEDVLEVDDGDEEEEVQPRSRTLSNSTLLASQSQQSQTQSQPHAFSRKSTQGSQRPEEVVLESSRKPTQGPKPVEVVSAASRKPTQAQKGEENAFAELLVLIRRHYLSTLSNKVVDAPIQAIFPGMKSTHPQYKRASYKVRQSYKNWKTAVLEAAADFVTRWLGTAKANEGVRLAALHTHRDLRRELINGFNIDWLEMVFRFAIPAVSFKDIGDDGLRFLKYAFVQIITLHRLNELHEKDTRDPRFGKYSRRHLLDVYDVLHEKTGFEFQTIDLYPERITPQVTQNRRNIKVDINNDSDGCWDEGDTTDDGLEDFVNDDE